MIVYHGSPNKFTEFDYSRIRTNGTTEGLGFYFTDTKRIARGYAQNGFLYTIKMNGAKPLSDNHKNLTKEEVKKLIIELDKHTDFLTNYGEVEYEGYENVLNTAVNNEYDFTDTDTNIMGSLYTSCGENEIVIKLFYELLGYDYIESEPEWGGEQTVYVALTNDVIDILEIEDIR